MLCDEVLDRRACGVLADMCGDFTHERVRIVLHLELLFVGERFVFPDRLLVGIRVSPALLGFGGVFLRLLRKKPV